MKTRSPSGGLFGRVLAALISAFHHNPHYTKGSITPPPCPPDESVAMIQSNPNTRFNSMGYKISCRTSNQRKARKMFRAGVANGFIR